MMELRKFLDSEVEDILSWLEEHEDSDIRIVTFRWKGFDFTWHHDYLYSVIYSATSPKGEMVYFESWEAAFDYVKEEVLEEYGE